MVRLAALISLLALPAFAQSPAAVDRLITVIEAAGCVVNDNNNQAILLASGLTQAEGSQIVTMLMSDGRAVPHGDDLRLTTGGCR